MINNGVYSAENLKFHTYYKKLSEQWSNFAQIIMFVGGLELIAHIFVGHKELITYVFVELLELVVHVFVGLESPIKTFAISS